MPLKELLDRYGAAYDEARNTLGGDIAKALDAAGLVIKEGMPSEEIQDIVIKSNAVIMEAYKNPSEDRKAKDNALTDLLNIVRPRLTEYENKIMDEMTGKEQLRAIIDLYELEPYNPKNTIHEQHKQAFKSYHMPRLSFTGRFPFFVGMWNPKARAFIAQHQVEILIELRKLSGRKVGRPIKTGEEVDLGHNLALPTYKGYEHSLSTYPKGKAYIAQIDKDFYNDLEYSGDRLHLKGRPDIPVTAQTLKLQAESEADIRVLEGLYSAFIRHYLSNRAKGIETLYGYNLIIPLPQLADFMGVDLRERKGAPGLFKRIMKYERYIGIMADGSMPRVLGYSDYDPESNTIVLNVPYFRRLITAMLKDAQVIKAGEDGALASYYRNTHGLLIHSDILGTRDPDAEAIVTQIQGLLLRGTPTGAEISFKQLVEQIPQLANALKNTTGKNAHDIAVARNKTLSRAFKRAYELLQEKTDLYEYFINLRVNGIAKGEKKKQLIPTYKYLETKDLKLTLTHEGPNDKYTAEVKLIWGTDLLNLGN